MKKALLYSLKILLVSILVATAVFVFITYYSAADYFQYNIIQIVGILIFLLKTILFICAWSSTIVFIAKHKINTICKKIIVGVAGIVFSMAFLFLPQVEWLLTRNGFFFNWHITYLLTFILSTLMFKLPQLSAADV